MGSIGPRRAPFYTEVLRNSHDTAFVSSIRGSSHASLRTVLHRASGPGRHWFPAVERGQAAQFDVCLPPDPGETPYEICDEFVRDFEDTGNGQAIIYLQAGDLQAAIGYSLCVHPWAANE
jgi:hypothetical protein